MLWFGCCCGEHVDVLTHRRWLECRTRHGGRRNRHRNFTGASSLPLCRWIGSSSILGGWLRNYEISCPSLQHPATSTFPDCAFFQSRHLHFHFHFRCARFSYHHSPLHLVSLLNPPITLHNQLDVISINPPILLSIASTFSCRPLFPLLGRATRSLAVPNNPDPNPISSPSCVFPRSCSLCHVRSQTSKPKSFVLTTVLFHFFQHLTSQFNFMFLFTLSSYFKLCCDCHLGPFPVNCHIF